MPSLPSPEPAISCFDDLDFFKDFEKEFPPIVYNDAQTSKSDLLTEPILSPQHIDQFDLNDKTSLSKYDEEEQNVLYFNDLFPFNIIHPDDSKTEKDNDDNEINIIQSSGDMALPPRDQRHQYRRYKGLQYTDADIVDFETRLARIYRREVHKVMLMEHKDAQGVSLFSSQAWRRLFDIRGSLEAPELEAVYFSLRIYTADDGDAGTLDFCALLGVKSERKILRQGGYERLLDNIAGRSQALEKVTVTDLFYLRRMDVVLVNVPYLLARYLRLFADGRKTGPPGVAQDAPAVNKGVYAVPTPVQAPPSPPAATRTMPQRMARLEEDVHEIRRALAEQR
ncbi:hypothetical protein Tco_0781982 [Tanacetum coccineum]